MAKGGWYLLAYDICAPERLVRVRRRMRDDAVAAQQSVFFAFGTEAQIASLLDELARLLDGHQDDLRAWPIAGPGEVWYHGECPIDGALAPPRSKPAGARNDMPAPPPRAGWLRRLFGGGDGR